jgi:hypothetical protein
LRVSRGVCEACPLSLSLFLLLPPPFRSPLLQSGPAPSSRSACPDARTRRTGAPTAASCCAGGTRSTERRCLVRPSQRGPAAARVCSSSPWFEAVSAPYSGLSSARRRRRWNSGRQRHCTFPSFGQVVGPIHSKRGCSSSCAAPRGYGRAGAPSVVLFADRRLRVDSYPCATRGDSRGPKGTLQAVHFELAFLGAMDPPFTPRGCFAQAPLEGPR